MQSGIEERTLHAKGDSPIFADTKIGTVPTWQRYNDAVAHGFIALLESPL